MTLLKFRFTPSDDTDFDVCAGPARAEPPAPQPAEAERDQPRQTTSQPAKG
ncbi:protein of unknown function [Rhodovastum atsumiense]|uniref:hypothetical protein n=1 Tax=Rhodovastum atsumiense TaxID=504468 RepID=UPI00139F2C62|nr:hypothetical protein [Rhodovastum atsumiense]CAH2604592.1 protein of unknown function [Rhodovastum atsumiense]